MSAKENQLRNTVKKLLQERAVLQEEVVELRESAEKVVPKSKFDSVAVELSQMSEIHLISLEEIVRLHKEISTMKEEISALKKERDTLKEDRDALKTELNDDSMVKLRKRLHSAHEELFNVRRSLEDAKRRLEKLENGNSTGGKEFVLGQ